MAAVKTRYGVPGQLASCHTAVIGGYAIEGHVPMQHVARLLHDKPRDIRGIAVPGMPRGSPGMEMPDGSVDAFEVMAFGSDGKVSEFRALPADTKRRSEERRVGNEGVSTCSYRWVASY